MKPTPQLIKALRQVASDLRNRSHYNWQSTDSCNCGLLAQALGVSCYQLRVVGIEYTGPWTKKVRCESSGLLLRNVVDRLREAGVEMADFERIEYLDRGMPSNAMHSSKDYWAIPGNVALWMDQEADRLERLAAGAIANVSSVSARVTPPAQTTSTSGPAAVRWALEALTNEHPNPNPGRPCACHAA